MIEGPDDSVRTNATVGGRFATAEYAEPFHRARLAKDTLPVSLNCPPTYTEPAMLARASTLPSATTGPTADQEAPSH